MDMICYASRNTKPIFAAMKECVYQVSDTPVHVVHRLTMFEHSVGMGGLERCIVYELQAKFVATGARCQFSAQQTVLPTARW